MHHQAAHAYAKTAKITVSPRKLEADLLMKAARRLQAVKEGWPETEGDMRGALTYNRRLWTIFSTSATAADNPLPDAIKQNIGQSSACSSSSRRSRPRPARSRRC